MIYLSIGIAMLAIGSIVLTHKQTQIELQKAYEKGLHDGAEAVIRQWTRRHGDENEKD